jgi:hypothetical protein
MVSAARAVRKRREAAAMAARWRRRRRDFMKEGETERRGEEKTRTITTNAND